MSDLLLPPQNLEAERSVLGGILLDPEVFYDISDLLSPSDFYRAAYQAIYKAICDLVAKCKPVDAVQLSEELTSKGIFEKVGGHEVLLEIVNAVPHSANTKYHAEIVKEKAISRQVINAANEIVREGYTNQHTAAELTAIAEQKIFAVTQEQELGQIYQMPQAISMYSQLLQRRRDGLVDGLTTGFADLDELIMGMGKKQLIYLAARPGQGKSSLAMDICWHVSFTLHGKVLFISLEMSAEELTERLVSCISRIDSKRLKNPYLLDQLTNEENTRLMEAMAQITQSQLRINDCVGQTISQIASTARRMKARDGLDLLVIDYLGKIRRPESKKSTNDQIGDVSNSLKDLSGELSIPVLCLHQLTRESAREGTRPAMHQLRDCVTGDTRLIDAIHGSPIPIEKIQPGSLVYSMNRQQKIVANKVIDVWPVGKRQVYKLTTRSGRTIRATSDHPLFTPDGWKRLHEVKIGDQLAVVFRGSPIPKSRTISTDECRLLGYMVGNGSMQKSRTLGLIIPDDEAFADAQSIIKAKWPGISVHLRAEHNDAWISQTYENGWGKRGGNPMINWLRELGCHGVDALTKQVPDIVYRSGEDGIAAFLAGYLMTDGCVKGIHRNRPEIHWDTISKELANGIAHLCMRLGVFAVVDRGKMNTLSVHPVYRIKVSEESSNMARLCDRLSPYMRGVRGRKLQKAFEMSIARETRASAFALPPSISGLAAQADPRWRHQGKGISRRRLNKILEGIADPHLSMWASSDVVWDRVAEIQDAGTEQVWDVQIENAHSFVTAEGLVAHNCGHLEQDAHHIWLIHNQIPKTDSVGPVELIVEKNRNGGTGIIQLTYEKPFTHFSSISPMPEGANY